VAVMLGEASSQPSFIQGAFRCIKVLFFRPFFFLANPNKCSYLRAWEDIYIYLSTMIELYCHNVGISHFFLSFNIMTSTSMHSIFNFVCQWVGIRTLNFNHLLFHNIGYLPSETNMCNEVFYCLLDLQISL
jgi:hypothetical protein